jgi:flavin-dependent dehydrogenase
MARDREVVVLGGGPAGAAAALLLARWGHAVDLTTRPAAERGLAVSLPPSCAKLFDAIGVSDAIDSAAFARSKGNTVWWGGAAARVEPFADGARGWLVEVGALSELLLDQATTAGVNVERRVLEPDSNQTADAFVLDCTGRSGLIARRVGLRVFDEGPKTIALCGTWRRVGGWPVPDDTHTLVESYEDGWMWSVPIAPGVRHVAAMVDPQRSDLARGRTPADVYRSEIDKTREFRALMSGSVLVDGPRGFDASPYRATAYAGERWLLVGDAGSFIDPLSSAGVKKALASGWLAAIAVHTALTSSSRRAHAFEFFSAREVEIERHLSRDSRRFLAGAAAGHHHAFWDERSDDGDATTPESGEIRHAFERLKSGELWRFRTGPAIQIQPRPCIRGHEIALEPHVVSSAHPQGVRYVNGIDMVVVIDLAPSSRQVPDLFESYVRRAGPAPLPDFLFALATALARGWLVSE